MNARIFGSISCLCLALTSLLACHSSSSSEDTSSGGLAGACERVANANSAFAQRCGETLTAAGASDHDTHQIARTSAVCVAEYSLPGIPDPTTQLNQCASALAVAACNTQGELPVCAIASAGTLANGEPCNEGDQCSGGACIFPVVSADASVDAGAPTCGQCATGIASGQPCDESTPLGSCANNGVCSFDSSDNGHCVPAATYVAALGANCDQQNECAPPAYCSFDSTGNSGTCVASAKLGEACNDGSGNTPDLCEYPSTCSNSVCVAPAAYGESCDSNQCGAGLYCGTDAKCFAITYGPPGASCDGNSLQCIQGTCPGFSGGGQPTSACPAIIADGQTCDPSVSVPACDTFAGCAGGICTLVPGGQICK